MRKGEGWFISIARDGGMNMKIIKKIKANSVQVLEVLMLITVIFLPYILDIPSWFEDYLRDHKPEPEISNFLPYYILKAGNVAISLGLLFAVLIVIRRYNKEFVMNNDNVYHDYPFIWYWFCAKVLGIKKCNLILVPIYMQFKLVIKNIFKDYPLDEMDFPVIEAEPECIIEKKNMRADLSEINLILEDTYVIESNQIPFRKKSLPTVKISRNTDNSHTRHFSPKFINSVSEEVRKFPTVSRVNIYATTNPMNTLRIARSAFKMADRGNIEHLFVYQQKREGLRKFEQEGHRIY